MKSCLNPLVVYLTVALFCLLSLTTYAQKQPNIQKGGVRAPANIKIDGALTEWKNNNLQAFNVSGRVYYAISNDDEHLYLTLRSTGLSAPLKILEGGLTFTIKTKTNNVSVTYPTGRERKPIEALVDISYRYDDVSKDTVANKQIIDSVQLAVNDRLNDLFTDIKVTGIKEITDPTIPLQNTFGIQANAQYNHHVQYIYELAIPLKYLGLSLDTPEKFKYTVTENPVWSQEVVIVGTPPPPMVMSNDVMFQGNAEYLYNNSPTTISGDYTLVK